MPKFLSTNILLILILFVAAIFRFYGLNWDQGQHLHPDERMITMVAEKISFADLNPHFFAYGSFPIYLLKISGELMGTFQPRFASYDSINLVGRFLSAIFDLGIIIILFFLGKKLFNQTVGLLAAFFYAVAVLPIQLAHFYTVDTLLTFFILLFLYQLINFSEKPSLKNLTLTSIFFGFALATKTSALVLLAPLSIVLLKFIFKPKQLISYLLLIAIIIPTAFFTLEPFALIDFPAFLKQTLEQQEMTKSAFTFPYTLQYVGKIPYLYELQNIFLWGLGPVLAILAFIGTFLLTSKLFKKPLDSRLLTLATFFWLYFAIVGHFAIGFMRYALPLYPLLCLFAAVALYSALHYLKNFFPPLILNIYYLILGLLLFIWPLSFIFIYSQPNTRTTASEWMLQNIPSGSTVTIESWDDGLPIGKSHTFQILSLPMNEFESVPDKWTRINGVLSQADFLVIASNRNYVPLMKLTDCPNLPEGRCYTKTASFYKQLFAGQLNFKEIAEFTTYPTIPFTNYQINDFSADESFTVYDHPKVIIFKRNNLMARN